MERYEIIKRLEPLVRAAFKDESLVLDESLDASMVSGWTSLSFMYLLESVESEFEIKFKVMELISIRTLGDLVDAIAKH